jgi:hypothetical protein
MIAMAGSKTLLFGTSIPGNEYELGYVFIDTDLAYSVIENVILGARRDRNSIQSNAVVHGKDRVVGTGDARLQ